MAILRDTRDEYGVEDRYSNETQTIKLEGPSLAHYNIP